MPFEKITETTNTLQQPVEKIAEVRVEFPKQMEVDKIIKMVEIEKVENPTTIAIEFPVPVDIIKKVVPVHIEAEKVVQVPQIVEKIVQIKVQEIVVI